MVYIISNRRQTILLPRGENPKKQEVTFGIPQGSCLGPLLFILQTNDFEMFLSMTYPNMYADDTQDFPLALRIHYNFKIPDEGVRETHGLAETK